MTARLTSLVALIVIALVGAPLVLDACAIDCGAHPHASMAMGAQCPMHAAGSHSWRGTAACGHDHHAVPATVAVPPHADRLVAVALAAPWLPSGVPAVVRFGRTPSASPPRPPLAAATPLRV